MEDDYTSAGPVVIRGPHQGTVVRWPYTREEFAEIVVPAGRTVPVEVPVGLAP